MASNLWNMSFSKEKSQYVWSKNSKPWKALERLLFIRCCIKKAHSFVALNRSFFFCFLLLLFFWIFFSNPSQSVNKNRSRTLSMEWSLYLWYEPIILGEFLHKLFTWFLLRRQLAVLILIAGLSLPYAMYFAALRLRWTHISYLWRIKIRTLEINASLL